MKSFYRAILLCLILLLVVGCGKTEETVATTEEKTTETKASPSDAFKNVYMDDYALSIMKEACQARWELTNNHEADLKYIEEHSIYQNETGYGEFHWMKELLTDFNQTEYDVICKYTSDNFNDRKFKDEKLKEYMISYAEASEQQLELGKHTDFSVLDEYNKYKEYTQTKGNIILDMMDKYDLKFDNAYITNVETLKTEMSE